MTLKIYMDLFIPKMNGNNLGDNSYQKFAYFMSTMSAMSTMDTMSRWLKLPSLDKTAMNHAWCFYNKSFKSKQKLLYCMKFPAIQDQNACNCQSIPEVSWRNSCLPEASLKHPWTNILGVSVWDMDRDKSTNPLTHTVTRSLLELLKSKGFWYHSN